MKKIFGLLVLSFSVGAFAQERVILDSKKKEVSDTKAILVRTAKTPKSVDVTFKAVLNRTVCLNGIYDQVPTTYSCTKPVYETRIRRICRDVPVTQAPRGPRYNPPGNSTPPPPATREVCTETPYSVEVGRVPGICVSYTSVCRQEVVRSYETTDKVKIKFKDLPNLGGSEEETFEVSTLSRGVDNSNVGYSIKPLKTLGDRQYKVKKKGILGVDSFVIQD